MFRQLADWTKLTNRSRKRKLTEAQRQVYKLEKVTNFRWVAQHLGRRSHYVLTAADRASDDIKIMLSQIGQFAEIAYGLYDQDLIWRNLDVFTRPDYPLEHYDALHESQLLTVLRGRNAGVKGLLAYRKKQKQLIVAFSGTSNVAQAFHDVDTFAVQYPGRRASGKAKVHAGFWRLYRGIRRATLEALAGCLTSEKRLDVEEVVVTGHSLGGALSIYLIMDLMNPEFCSKYLKGEQLAVSPGTSLTIVIYGAPRAGNSAFVELYRSSIAKFRSGPGEQKFSEFAVKAYNDGVPALPPHVFGFRHAVVESVLFFYRGRLYQIPSSENECLNFSTQDEEGDETSAPLYPWGGHNYYNDRSFETIIRRMGWIVPPEGGNLVDGWETKYAEKLKKELQKARRQKGQTTEKNSRATASRFLMRVSVVDDRAGRLSTIMATDISDSAQSARRKGKLRAPAEENSETTPLLGSSHQLIHDEIVPSTELSRYRHRLLVLLSTVFLSTLGLCILVGLSLLALMYSYSSKVANAVREGVLDRTLVVRGPERVDVLNVTEGSVWLQVDVRVGVDGGTAVDAVVDSGKTWFSPTDIQRALGRWMVRRMGQLTVSSDEITLLSGERLLANVTIPAISLALTLDHPNDLSWLTPLSLPVQVNATNNATDLTVFAQESWRTGYVIATALMRHISVQGGSESETSWRSRLKVKQDNVIVPARLRIPDLPGLPTPGRGTPFPEFSDLVTLKSIHVTSANHSISIHASASVIDPMPASLHMRIPSIPFYVSLSDMNSSNTTAVTVTTGHTKPFSFTHPNITLSLVGAVPPIPRSASPLISTFLSAYLSGVDAPITVGSPLFPALRIPALFPAPHPKPKLLQDVHIKDMRITLHGESILASGTIYAHVVLPMGINVGLDARKIWPDVLVFDGDVPDENDTSDYSYSDVLGLFTLPAKPTFNWPSRTSKGSKDKKKKERATIPKEPLPSPLPERAFARIRPDDWLPAHSEPITTPVGDAAEYEITAEVVDVPLEVLPGRDSLLRSFVAKVLFSGREGALAGVKGTAAVAAAVDGLPVRDRDDDDDDDDGSGEHVMELTGLPFSGSVRVGRKGL
ncbi:hypothetical protein EW145_g2327 [Phellinidium pouzarii]|uniref:Fungal lipase-type domain-containing protein n=1 Tax=Phellinidium pouzarii TaxID=167371 RepID=A0A4S4LBE4_9AGAM|nr:hypothetical protein EW145_g2327 [Phellinidium pouzarii]